MPKVIHAADGSPNTPSQIYQVRLLIRQLDLLKLYSKRSGVPIAEAIRRGVDLYLMQEKVR